MKDKIRIENYTKTNKNKSRCCKGHMENTIFKLNFNTAVKMVV